MGFGQDLKVVTADFLFGDMVVALGMRLTMTR